MKIFFNRLWKQIQAGQTNTNISDIFSWLKELKCYKTNAIFIMPKNHLQGEIIDPTKPNN